jgi:FkbM family methyltransferase
MIIERVTDALTRRVRRLWEPAVLWARSRGAVDGYVCREILGSRMYLDVQDPGICRDLLIHGIREDWAIAVMRETLRPGQTVVDVGANIGYYVLFEASLVGPSGRVYGIEPVPDNFSLLERNVALNVYGTIELHRFAVSETPGRSVMHLSHLRNWHAMTPVQGTGRTIDVEVQPLDAFLDGKPFPALVRMDVEGHEYQILRGMQRTIAEAPDLTLFIEIHPHIIGAEKMRSMLSMLVTHGYDVARFASRRGEEHTTIARLLADEPFLSGTRGGALVFFARPR